MAVKKSRKFSGFAIIVNTAHFQQLKVMQSSNLGLWDWYYLSMEGIRTAVPLISVKNGISAGVIARLLM